MSGEAAGCFERLQHLLNCARARAQTANPAATSGRPGSPIAYPISTAASAAMLSAADRVHGFTNHLTAAPF
jgi:hypothetical protein